MDFDDFNIVGLIGGVIGGMISIIVTQRMEGGIMLKVLGFIITGTICYFMASKLMDD